MVAAHRTQRGAARLDDQRANCNDSLLLEPTLTAVKARGLLAEIETLHLDRGYDSRVVRDLVAGFGIDDLVCPRKRKAGTAAAKKLVPLGMRWPVERTNSWLSNFGQLRPGSCSGALSLLVRQRQADPGPGGRAGGALARDR